MLQHALSNDVPDTCGHSHITCPRIASSTSSRFSILPSALATAQSSLEGKCLKRNKFHDAAIFYVYYMHSSVFCRCLENWNNTSQRLLVQVPPRVCHNLCSTNYIHLSMTTISTFSCRSCIFLKMILHKFWSLFMQFVFGHRSVTINHVYLYCSVHACAFC